MHSNCILDSVANLLVRHMVFVGNILQLSILTNIKLVYYFQLNLGICSMQGVLSKLCLLPHFIFFGLKGGTLK